MRSAIALVALCTVFHSTSAAGPRYSDTPLNNSNKANSSSRYLCRTQRVFAGRNASQNLKLHTNRQSCATAAYDVCQSFIYDGVNKGPSRDQWINSTSGDCIAAFYMPSTSNLNYTYQQCLNSSFLPMVATCIHLKRRSDQPRFDTPNDFGTINVKLKMNGTEWLVDKRHAAFLVTSRAEAALPAVGHYQVGVPNDIESLSRGDASVQATSYGRYGEGEGASRKGS
ncbi:MAG: hypothetical protein M1812_004643 [Candelaria pacifica]|nr:MAG: hypothetical protein M1812_004643 [Candelaria pacifica]